MNFQDRPSGVSQGGHQGEGGKGHSAHNCPKHRNHEDGLKIVALVGVVH
jgi:hypothetical protein